MEKLDPRIILKGKKAVAKEQGVELRDLKYIGATDCTMLESGWYQLLFNIITKNHAKYDGTFAYDHKPRRNL